MIRLEGASYDEIKILNEIDEHITTFLAYVKSAFPRSLHHDMAGNFQKNRDFALILSWHRNYGSVSKWVRQLLCYHEILLSPESSCHDVMTMGKPVSIVPEK